MAVKKQRKGISAILLISIFLIIIGILLFKISLTGNTTIPICNGGPNTVNFNVYGSKTSDITNDGQLNKVTVTLQPVTGKNCMYLDKTDKNGNAILTRVVSGVYKLIIIQKDIGGGKTLCDVYKDTIEVKSDEDYTIALTNCNNHAFTL